MFHLSGFNFYAFFTNCLFRYVESVLLSSMIFISVFVDFISTSVIWVLFHICLSLTLWT